MGINLPASYWDIEQSPKKKVEGLCVCACMSDRMLRHGTSCARADMLRGTQSCSGCAGVPEESEPCEENRAFSIREQSPTTWLELTTYCQEESCLYTCKFAL